MRIITLLFKKESNEDLILKLKKEIEFCEWQIKNNHDLNNNERLILSTEKRKRERRINRILST